MLGGKEVGRPLPSVRGLQRGGNSGPPGWKGILWAETAGQRTQQSTCPLGLERPWLTLHLCLECSRILPHPLSLSRGRAPSDPHLSQLWRCQLTPEAPPWKHSLPCIALVSSALPEMSVLCDRCQILKAQGGYHTGER